MGFLSLNVRGLGTPAKRFVVLRELERLNYDLFLLQETHVSPKQLMDEIARSWPGQCFWPFGEANLLVLLYLSLPDSRVKFLDFFSILTVKFLAHWYC